MRVDTEREKMLRIDFNLTFPALPCSTLMMDVGDVSGSYASERGLSMAQCVWGEGGGVLGEACVRACVAPARVL